MKNYILAYDVGTTGIKTCICEIDKDIKILASASESYNLYVYDDGGAEQDPEEWWAAMCSTTRTVFAKADIDPKDVAGISFCSQAQGLVLVDKDGKAIRRAFSYMDQRARREIKEGIAHGLQIAGANIFKLIPALMITGAAPVSVKDPVWKYNWVKNNEPENFKKVYGKLNNKYSNKEMHRYKTLITFPD